MGDSGATLAALIGSRICHDLISPIGAISNGLELLGLAGSIKGPEFDLISDSVTNAGARIRFFRIAYGAAGEQMLGRPEIASVLEDVSRSGRIKMRWTPAEPQPRTEVRLAFLALQCCETAMPYGGTVEVNATEGAWTVSGAADKMICDPRLWAHLDGSSADLAEIVPATVQFALLPTLAGDMGRSLGQSAEGGRVFIRF